MLKPSFGARLKRSGVWEAWWRDEQRQMRGKSPFVSEAEAKQYAQREAYKAIANFCNLPPQGKDIREALDSFHSRGDVTESTHEVNRRVLGAFVKHTKIKDVNDMNYPMMTAYLKHLKDKGHNNGGQLHNMRQLIAFCRYCEFNGWLSTKPFPEEPGRAIRLPKKEFRGRALTNSEVKALLAINPRYRVDWHLNRAIRFALYTALRISQIWKLKPEDLRADGRLYVPGIKHQDTRVPKLHPDALKALQEMLAVSKGDRIFSNWKSSALLRASYIGKVKRAGLLGRVRFHDLKHTAITNMLNSGMSVTEVSLISGTTVQCILAVYAHADADAAYDKLRKISYELPDQQLSEDGRKDNEHPQ